MEIIVQGKTCDLDDEICPGELDFENITVLSDEDFVKTVELDLESINNGISGGDNNE